MFGLNPTRPKEQTPDQRIIFIQGEPFKTIQGEGPFAGVPATFLRLWGCHLRCWFCDTDFESARHGASVEALVAFCRSHESAPLVVLTGGEPMRQNITSLCLELLRLGKLVQIETAGSFWIDDGQWPRVAAHPDLTIVCSPKTPGVDPQLARVITAWKYVVSTNYGQDPLDGLPLANTQERDGKRRRLARPPVAGQVSRPSKIFVQPMDEGDPVKNQANLERCLQLSQTYGYRISVQLHKQWGLP